MSQRINLDIHKKLELIWVSENSCIELLLLRRDIVGYNILLRGFIFLRMSMVLHRVTTIVLLELMQFW